MMEELPINAPHRAIETSVQVNRPLINESVLLGRNNKQSYVPFLIKAKRFTSKNLSVGSPPIGTYNLPSCFQNKFIFQDARISRYLIETQKRKSQMSVFKSQINRFQMMKHQVPGPASYNLFKKMPTDTIALKSLPNRQSEVKERKIQIQKNCPSIPDGRNKYGYKYVDGKAKIIEKGSEQLENQKKSKQEYANTLIGQKQLLWEQCERRVYRHQDQKKKLYLISKKIVSKQQKDSNQITSTKTNTSHTFKKPKFQHLYDSRATTSQQHKILLGPGAYDVNLNTLQSKSKTQKFQFFGSSSLRFNEKLGDMKKGLSLIQIIKSSEKLKIVKKNRIPKQKKDRESKKNILLNKEQECQPGPGEYEPQDSVIRKFRGGVVFPQQERFRDNRGSDLISMEEGDYQQFQLKSTAGQMKRKNEPVGQLKKQRFKPLHPPCQPIKSDQIYGILNELPENYEMKQVQSKKIKIPTAPFGKKSPRFNSDKKKEDEQDISSWQAEVWKENRPQNIKGCYIRELGDESLKAIVTPGPGDYDSMPRPKKTFNIKHMK